MKKPGSKKASTMRSANPERITKTNDKDKQILKQGFSKPKGGKK